MVFLLRVSYSKDALLKNLLPGGRVGASGSCNMRREATEVHMARKVSCDEALMPVPTLAAMRANKAEPRDSIFRARSC